MYKKKERKEKGERAGVERSFQVGY